MDKQKLIIPYEDISFCNILGEKVFSIKTTTNNNITCIIKDNYIDLKKNDVGFLRLLAKKCGLKGYNKIRKNELLDLIEEHIIFEE